MLKDVFDSYRQAFRLIWVFLIIHTFFRLVSAAIVVPVIGMLAGLAISMSGQAALTDQDIARFLATPAGALSGLVVVSLLIASTTLDLAMMTSVLRSNRLSPLAALKTATGFVLRAAAPMTRFAAGLLLRVLLIAAPYLLLAAAVACLMLREYDINYYLTARPPDFLLAASLMLTALAALGVVLIRRLADWAIALHLVLFDGRSNAAAFSQSAATMRSHRKGLLARIGLWLLMRLLLAAGVAFLATLALAALPDLFGNNLRLIASVLIVVVLLWGLCDLLISAVANGALADALNTVFDHALAGSTPRIDADPRAAIGWGSPGTLGLVAILVFSVASLAGGGVLVDQIKADSEVAIIGHRGAAGSRPENTMAAVEKAIADGADWVEVDVQETADGEVVVVHDSDFMKAAGVKLKVWDATMQDLAGIDIGSRFDAAYADQRTPLLRDVLATARGRAGVIIELKYYGHDVDLENRVIALVEAAGMSDQIAIMSLHYPAVKKMRQLRPDWRTGVLAATSIGKLSALESDFLAVNLGQVSRRLLARAQSGGKDVYAWTVNDPLTMSRMISIGVDGLITDEPALARQVIQYRASLDAPERMLLWVSDQLRLVLNISEVDEIEQ